MLLSFKGKKMAKTSSETRLLIALFSKNGK